VRPVWLPDREASFGVYDRKARYARRTLKEIVLDASAFLDSPQAAKLSAPPREAQKSIIEAYLRVAYQELGKSPRHLDGQDLHAAVGHLLPAHFGRKDPLAEHVPAVLEA